MTMGRQPNLQRAISLRAGPAALTPALRRSPAAGRAQGRALAACPPHFADSQSATLTLRAFRRLCGFFLRRQVSQQAHFLILRAQLGQQAHLLVVPFQPFRRMR